MKMDQLICLKAFLCLFILSFNYWKKLILGYGYYWRPYYNWNVIIEDPTITEMLLLKTLL